jgi:hypothetical protein
MALHSRYANKEGSGGDFPVGKFNIFLGNIKTKNIFVKL